MSDSTTVLHRLRLANPIDAYRARTGHLLTVREARKYAVPKKDESIVSATMGRSSSSGMSRSDELIPGRNLVTLRGHC
jgi:hypothetical protein